MSEPTTKAGWLAAIEAEREGWEALVAEVGEGRMTEPGVTESWSFKDVTAQLNGWRRPTVDRLEAAVRGVPTPPPPWPSELDEDSDAGLDQINRCMHERDQHRSVRDVLEESRRQFRRLHAAVEALPERDLLELGRFAWMGGEPLVAVLRGSFGHLHEEHEPAIRAWLAARSASG